MRPCPTIRRLRLESSTAAGDRSASTATARSRTPSSTRACDWHETGTRHRPGIQSADVAELLERGATTVVLSTGVLRMLGVCPETLRRLESCGVAVDVLPTPEAVETYNRLVDGEAAVGALIHSTC